MWGRLRIISEKSVQTLPSNITSQPLYPFMYLCRLYHDNSRRAKATLASISHCNPLLDRMGILDISDALDGDDMLAIDTDNGRQTGVDGRMVEFLRSLVDIGHHLDCCQKVVPGPFHIGSASCECVLYGV